jgi:hypothetical protein
MFDIRVHRSMNWERCSMVKELSRAIFVTHASSHSAYETFQFFLFEIAKMSGAMSIGFLPSSHGANQKGVFFPFPRVIVVAA